MWGMAYADGQLFLPDYEGSRVLVTDDDLNAQYQIGRRGEGPGELLKASFTTVDEGRVFVKSSRNQRISVFDTSGQFLYWVPVPELLIGSRFAVHEDTLFISSPTLKQPIIAVDLDGNHLFPMGTPQYPDDFEKRRARTGKHLHKAIIDEQPVIVAVGETEPEIELFSPDGQRILHKRLDQNPLLKARLEEANNMYKDPANKGKSILLFYDVSLVDQSLWLFCYSSDPPYRIIHYKLSTTDISLVEVVEIQENIAIQSIAFANEEKMFLYNTWDNAVWSYYLER